MLTMDETKAEMAVRRQNITAALATRSTRVCGDSTSFSEAVAGAMSSRGVAAALGVPFIEAWAHMG